MLNAGLIGQNDTRVLFQPMFAPDTKQKPRNMGNSQRIPEAFD